MTDGWIKDENDNLLIWVPDEYWASLRSYGMLALIGREPIDVDFGNACHGTNWAKCTTL